MILGQSYATCFLACAKLTDIHDRVSSSRRKKIIWSFSHIQISRLKHYSVLTIFCLPLSYRVVFDCSVDGVSFCPQLCVRLLFDCHNGISNIGHSFLLSNGYEKLLLAKFCDCQNVQFNMP